MIVIIPNPIDEAMLIASSIDEPDVSETAWVSGGTYEVGDRRIRDTTHRIYECVQDHTGRTPLPENDALYWLEYRPTNRWAMFDNVISTQTIGTSPLQVVLSPGFFNSVALYGLLGTTVTVAVKDEPGGTTTFSETFDLTADSIDWYEWVFTPSRIKSKVVVTGIEPWGEAELAITVNATSGNSAIGAVIVGDARELDVSGGGSQYDARAEPVDFSYIKTEEDGTTRIRGGHKATDMRVEVVVMHQDADAALQAIQDVLGVPAAWIATEADSYAGLNAFGLGSASLAYAGPKHSLLSITVKGLI